jgi:hypothetical protein
MASTAAIRAQGLDVFFEQALDEEAAEVRHRPQEVVNHLLIDLRLIDHFSAQFTILWALFKELPRENCV